jgi:hypothetical protein
MVFEYSDWPKTMLESHCRCNNTILEPISKTFKGFRKPLVNCI